MTAPEPRIEIARPLAGEAFGRTISRMAHEIIEAHEDLGPAVLVGVRSRGSHLARRLARRIAEIADIQVPVGTLDITLYRDDLRARSDYPDLVRTEIPVDLEGALVLLVDDVLYTGRSIRAALEGLMALGRPARIELAVLVDRGHRELPIRADYVGKNVPTSPTETIRVRFVEDGADEDAVCLMALPEGKHAG
ncbi:MAG: bifunctional pyr operon transcriptional regulator/uracil phosphoribosyltransferase PyrR [Nitrospirota bacterium]|jgi:pyrimidine operon attenuation protein/uracil phosphoribosyltransferase